MSENGAETAAGIGFAESGPNMLRLILSLRLVLLTLGVVAVAHCAIGADAPAPTADERLAALEAYVSNGDPGKALTGVAGPGHNAPG